jgi:hypothetical protein
MALLARKQGHFLKNTKLQNKCPIQIQIAAIGSGKITLNAENPSLLPAWFARPYPFPIGGFDWSIHQCSRLSFQIDSLGELS